VTRVGFVFEIYMPGAGGLNYPVDDLRYTFCSYSFLVISLFGIIGSTMLPRNDHRSQSSQSSRGLAALGIVTGFVMLLQFWPRSTLHSEGALLTDTRSFKPALPQVTTPVPYDPAKNPLAVPPGKARNLPSIRVEDTLDERSKTTKYGGKGE
jgi:hypothetical protein